MSLGLLVAPQLAGAQPEDAPAPAPDEAAPAEAAEAPEAADTPEAPAETPAEAEEAPAEAAAEEPPPPPAAPKTPTRPPTPPPAPVPASMPAWTPAPAEDAAPAGRPLVTESGFEVTIGGYVRGQYTAIQDDTARSDFVGRNDGFMLGNARLKVDAEKDDLHIHVSFDGAVDRRDANNTATGRVEMQVKDAFVEYSVTPGLNLQVGQFKPPFDAEELQSTKDMLFVFRAVESRGVKGIEGFNMDGLSIDRQAGLMVYSDPMFHFGEDNFGYAYYLSVTNGSGANQPLNDNDKLAYTGRLELMFGSWVTLGAGVNFNEVTTRVQPDQLNEEHLSMAVDLHARAYGVLLGAQMMQRTSSFPDVDGEPDRVSQGFHAQIGYEAPWGIIPAYRFATYDPTAEFEAEDAALEATLDSDSVVHHTVGLNWLVPETTLKLQVNYTLVQEDEARDLKNDRFDALVQAHF
jgi:hypothetical protein